MLHLNYIWSPVFIMSSPIRVVPYSGSLLFVAFLNNLQMRKCSNPNKKPFWRIQVKKMQKTKLKKMRKMGGKLGNFSDSPRQNANKMKKNVQKMDQKMQRKCEKCICIFCPPPSDEYMSTSDIRESGVHGGKYYLVNNAATKTHIPTNFVEKTKPSHRVVKNMSIFWGNRTFK